MARMLVLVRHGKAQSRDKGLPDFERQLTGAGKRALQDWLPKSRRLMDAEKASTYELWASPAERTMQTAHVIVNEWGKRLDGFPRTPLAVDALWRQDTAELLNLVGESRADAVVVCGHNPQIEELCADLTGCDITFATGGIAAIRLDEGAHARSGRLLWFVQGPESRNWKHH